jgi:hypothetical protein
MGSPVILGDGMDVDDSALTNLSFIVYSFGTWSGLGGFLLTCCLVDLVDVQRPGFIPCKLNPEA